MKLDVLLDAATFSLVETDRRERTVKEDGHVRLDYSENVTSPTNHLVHSVQATDIHTTTYVIHDFNTSLYFLVEICVCSRTVMISLGETVVLLKR
jgi:hypothetical protein